MKVLVLGSGVGRRCHRALSGRGRSRGDDGRAQTGTGAGDPDFANAGEVSPGYSSPWAGPGIPVKAIKWLLMRHGPLVIRPMVDPAMWRWVFMMLANCTSARYAVNKARMVPIAEYSRDRRHPVRAATGIAYDERSQGTLQLFRKQYRLDGIGGDIEVLKRYGVPFEVLDPPGCIAVEPALAKVQGKVRGRPAPAGRRNRRLPDVHDQAGQACGRPWRRIPVRYDHRGDRDARRPAPNRRAHQRRTPDGRRLCRGAGQLLADHAEAARPLAQGLSDQGLFDHRADHRRQRCARIDRHGRDLQR